MKHAKREAFVAYPPPHKVALVPPKDRRRAKHWRPLDYVVAFLALSGVFFWFVVTLCVLLYIIGSAVA